MRQGAEVVLVSGPSALEAPAGVRRIDVTSAEEMRRACMGALPVDMAMRGGGGGLDGCAAFG